MMIYISGKITGDSDYKEKFRKAKDIIKNELNVQPSSIVNPAEMVLPECCEYEDYLLTCFQLMRKCDAVVMLDDWKESKGAKLEFDYAKACNKAIFRLDSRELMKE